MDNEKLVSVIIPTYNEEKNIIRCLESLLVTDYPTKKLEFIIADGQSRDRTRILVEEFKKKRPDLQIKLIINPEKLQGYGLNRAIKSIDKRSDIVLRIDAHSIYPENYIRKSVDTLIETGSDNVGGVMDPVGNTPTQRAIAYCMKHPLGVGNAKFHLGNHSGYVDTVYLGCFKRDVFEKIGLYDSKMTPNEDAELNLRIIKNRGKIYLDKNIRVQYFPRESLKGLLKQYFRYGQGRCRTFKKHKALTSYRQLIPPVWIILSFLCLIFGFLSTIFFIPIIFYLLCMLSVSLFAFLKGCKNNPILIFLSFIIMHYSWGAGFLKELLFSKNKIDV
jgi:glycosyltransferase involved in cell wall biosynthesis